MGILLQGIFPTQESNPGLPHCRQILYQLSHKGSPRADVVCTRVVCKECQCLGLAEGLWLPYPEKGGGENVYGGSTGNKLDYFTILCITNSAWKPVKATVARSVTMCCGIEKGLSVHYSV